MSQSGTILRENNDKICKLMTLLKEERDEMIFLIEKQKEEKNFLQNEIEKYTFKLTLLSKSLHQRIKAKANYDKTINEIEDNYAYLVDESEKLLNNLNTEVDQLENIMDKKIGTAVNSSAEKVETSENDTRPSVAVPLSLIHNGSKEGTQRTLKPTLSKSQSNTSKNADDASITPQKLTDPIHPQTEDELQGFRNAYHKQHCKQSFSRN